MSMVSLLGMLALLGVAWAISYHRSQIKLRPIFWGLGLQLVLALILLREDFWSHVGMVALTSLIVAYLFHEHAARPEANTPRLVGTVVAVSLAAAWAAASAPPQIVVAVLVGVVLAAAINARFDFRPRLTPWLMTLIFVVTTAGLIGQGIYGREIFAAFSSKVASFLSLSDYGAKFLFGNLADAQFFATGPDAAWPGFGAQFAFKVLPTIIFFGGFMAVLYYFGIIQILINTIARFMRWTIGTSGAETLSCSANVFIGQTEAPLLIRPFLPGMTRSELLTVMVGGFATIAGGVLAGFIALGVPAGHLLAATVMSAPAALVIGKIIFPEQEHSETAGDVGLPEIEVGDNVIEAAAGGITDGLKLAVNVGAMLIGFIALIAVIDVLLNFVDGLIDGRLLKGALVTYSAGGLSPVTSEFTGIFPGSLQTLFGTLLRPLAFLMGVPWVDAAKVGNLLGVKLSLNEVVSFGTLAGYIQNSEIGERSAIIATYALCGFANFSSIGIQIGGISALVPERKQELAQLGLRAMIGGALASWLTATIAGMMLSGNG